MLRWSIEKTGGKEEGREGKRRKRVGKEIECIEENQDKKKRKKKSRRKAETMKENEKLR